MMQYNNTLAEVDNREKSNITIEILKKSKKNSITPKLFSHLIRHLEGIAVMVRPLSKLSSLQCFASISGFIKCLCRGSVKFLV
jgi:hypothetical protein